MTRRREYALYSKFYLLFVTVKMIDDKNSK